MSQRETPAKETSGVHVVAATAAQRAVTQAGVKTRLLDSVKEFKAASNLTARIWGDSESKAPASFLRALAHAGNFVGGVFWNTELVGVSIRPPVMAVALRFDSSYCLGSRTGRGAGAGSAAPGTGGLNTTSGNYLRAAAASNRCSAHAFSSPAWQAGQPLRCAGIACSASSRRS